MKKILITLGVLLSVMANAPAIQAGQTLQAVKNKNFVQCGVLTSGTFYARLDSSENWQGFDVDFCRAIATAVLGDASKVKYSSLDATKTKEALQSGEIDILARNRGKLARDDEESGVFLLAARRHYDTKRVMAKKSLEVTQLKELDGSYICIVNGTVDFRLTAEWFRINYKFFTEFLYNNFSEASSAFENGKCDGLVASQAELLSERQDRGKPGNFIILNGTLGESTVGPLVRNDDLDWNRVVEAVHHAQLRAEELGVTSKNVDEMRQSTDPDVQKLLGVTGDVGTKLGLSPYWAYEVIRQVGNYGEIFDKNNKNYGIQRASQNILTQKGKNSASPFY